MFQFSLLAQELDFTEIEVPDFHLTDLNGNIIQKSDLAEKVVVMDFWATWCAPCIKSFPAMIATEHNFKGEENVIFLFINTLESAGRDEDYINDFLGKRGFEIQVYLDRPLVGEKSLSEVLGITSLPQRVFLDPSGKIRYRGKGFTGSDEELIRDLTFKVNSLLTD